MFYLFIHCFFLQPLQLAYRGKRRRQSPADLHSNKKPHSINGGVGIKTGFCFK